VAVSPEVPTRRPRREAGSILVVAMIAMGVLALLAAAALHEVGNRHAVTFHSQSWNEALSSAEVGADIALAAMNASMSSPTTAWAAWTPANATTFPKTWTPALAAHGGDGNNKVYARITVDDVIVDPSGQKWFRIRSTGVAEVAGTARAGIEPAALDAWGMKNHRSVLRKTRFTTDLTGGALRLPQIARTVEVVAGAVNARLLKRALAVRSSITLSGDTSIDSFDSSDPHKSTGGLYDAAKRQDRADVATDGDGTMSHFNDREVRGSAFSNGGSIQGTGGVVGPIFDNFSTTLPAVTTPVWGVLNVTPNAIVNPPGGMTLVGGPTGTPQNYKVSELTLSSSSVLTLAPHAPGQTSYVNLWITGPLDINGLGAIQQQAGVHLTLYCEGNVSIQGGGIVNQNGRAHFLKIFGVDPASGTRTFTVGGSGTFVGVINAPGFDLTVTGASSFHGAAIARSAAISIAEGFHYDEDLGNLNIGPPDRYEFASWIEDIR